MASRPGGSIDEDPGWGDLEENWLRPKIPRSEIRVLLEEKRNRLAKEEELKKAEKATRKRGAPNPKSTKEDPVENKKSSPLASPKATAKKKCKKSPKQQLLQFPKSGRTGSWVHKF